MTSVRPAGTMVPNKPMVLDANVYATKKSVAQGMLDVALLTANASQLKYLLQVGDEHQFFYLMVILISLSIVLQMCVGILILVKSRYSINDESQQHIAERLNNALVWLIFSTTVINCFLSVFGISPITVGVLIIIIGSMNVNDEKHQRPADILNNIITIGIFLITIVNIIISALGMKQSDDHPEVYKALY